jgi:ATP diphosphatase
LLAIAKALRDPAKGCPWDREQSFDSLKPLIIEEAYEVADAVSHGTTAAICEELGDILSLIALFAQIADERAEFNFGDIILTICDKLVRRHPHVFGELKVSSTSEVLRNWELIKKGEASAADAETSKKKGLLDGVPKSLPALLKAHQIGRRAGAVGFDWPSKEAVADKVREEVGEFLNEVKDDVGPPNATCSESAFEEFGDLLFSLAQYARFSGFNPEEALNFANEKFISRFKRLEELSAKSHPGVELSSLTSEELDELWAAVKKL